MQQKDEKKASILVRGLARWVDGVSRAAWLVLLVAILATAGSLYYVASNIRINTDTSAVLSPDLPFLQQYEEFKEAFPQFSGSVVIVIDGDNADLAREAAAAMEERLRNDTELFKSVFYPAGDPFFRTNGLLYLNRQELSDLSGRLAEAQPLLSSLAQDMSLRGFFGLLAEAAEETAKGNAEPTGLDRVLAAIAETVDAELAGRGRRISWSELMTGGGDSVEDRRRIIVTQPNQDFASLRPAARAMSAIRRHAEELGIGAENGTRLRLTGGAALRTEELDSVSDGASDAGIMSLLVVLTLLFVGLRSLRLVVATIITLLMGLIWTAAFATVAIGHLTLISVAFAVLFIGLGVDFGIHFSLRYQEAARHKGRHGDALERAATGVGAALLLSALCAAISFYSFLPTSYKGVSELGLISGTGMFIALFANFTVLPALLSVIPARRWHTAGFFAGRVRRLRDRAEDSILTNSRRIAYGALALGLVGAVIALQIRFDFNPFNLRDPNQESVQTALDLMANSKTSPDTINVLAANLDAAAALGERLEKLDLVDHAVTLRDIVPKFQEEKLAIIDDIALFLTPLLTSDVVDAPPTPNEQRAAVSSLRSALEMLFASGKAADKGLEGAAPLAASLRRFDSALDARGAEADEMLARLEHDLLAFLPPRLEDLKQSLDAAPVDIDALPASIRDRQIAADGRARVEVFPTENLRDNEALRRFVNEVRSLAPEATDSSVVQLEAGDAIVSSFKRATSMALFLILVLLALLLRNPWDISLVLMPLVLAAVLTIATAVLFGLAMNFANVIVIPLLLGLGVASAIHLVMRQRHDGGKDLLETSTPRAVLFSALTTIGSFGSLAISDHRGTASMGALLTIAIAMTLVCTLIVLPALMELRRSWSAHHG